MIGIADFFLPVVLPPKKDFSNTLAYYSGIEAQGVVVSAAAQSPGGPMQITVEKADVLHTDMLTPMSTVFTATAGFVTYAQGNVELRVWSDDFKDLVKPASGMRPNRIVYGSLDSASVQQAIANTVAKLKLGLLILQESWTEAGGSGPMPIRADLETAMVQRFMAGTASIFVDAGTPIGTGSISTGPNGPVATLTLQAVFDAAGPPAPISVPPEDLIDSALEVRRLAKFAGHPLIKATSASINIHFLSRFLVWDNTAYDYVPLANSNVTLLVGAPVPTTVADLVPTATVATAQTDTAGRINLTVPLPARAMISFQYATTGRTYGNRLFDKDIRTEPHKARLHVDSNYENTRDYRAKYEILPEYQKFLDDIAAQGSDDEALALDRGNSDWRDTDNPLDTAALALPDFVQQVQLVYSQRDRIKQIAAAEAFYKADFIPPKAKTFNLLVEGDSWLNYPLAFNDIYGHLDKIFASRLKADVAYNRFPLQHLGDRSYQMFRAEPGKTRQWNFTEDFLKEYRIDMILCSAGGNDFAEPGISGKFKKKPYSNYITDSYFNPFWAQVSLTATEMAAMKKLLLQSFAVLLQNHPWNFFIRNKTGVPLGEAAMTAALDPLLAAVGSAFGPDPAVLAALGVPPGSVDNTWAPLVLQPIGQQVIANWPDVVAPGSPHDALLQFVFDRTSGSLTGLYEQRFSDTKANWEVLLTAAGNLGIPVISHTYGYPLFNENPASYFGAGNWNITGPWFNHRFREANIVDRRIEKICLKALLDDFVNKILKPLKAQYPLFDYVDVRNLNSSTELWRDEMHLRSKAFNEVAENIYHLAATNSQLSQFFVS
jgi:hypothetical protein